MGSISLLGTRTPQLVCLVAKSSGGRRHTLEQLQQTRVKVRREWKVKSQSQTQLKTQPEKMSNNPYGNLSAEVQSALANLKENGVKVVQHKYGNQAGDEFGKACTAAGNPAMTYMNIQSLGAKGLVKKTAKNTGKNIAKNIVGMGSEEKKEVTQAEVKQ